MVPLRAPLRAPCMVPLRGPLRAPCGVPVRAPCRVPLRAPFKLQLKREPLKEAFKPSGSTPGLGGRRGCRGGVVFPEQARGFGRKG